MSKTTIIIRYLRTAVSITLCAIAASAVPAAGQATFRIVSYMYQYGPPVGLTEGSPGIFYSVGGVPNYAAFSITTQGSKTILTVFPTSTYVTAPLVSAANGRLYS